MRGLEPKHYLLLSGFLGALAIQIGGLQHGWHDAVSPSFVAGLLLQISTMLAALYAGAPGATGQMTDRRDETAIKDPARFQPQPPAGGLLPAVLLTLGLCLSAGLFLPACAANKMPAGVVTPAGQSAYRADQVIARLSEISDVVIGDTGDFPGGIAPRDAYQIIEWISGDAHANPPTTGIAQIVAASGSGQGWKITAFQSWNSRIRPLLLKYPSLAGWVGIVDGLLGVL